MILFPMIVIQDLTYGLTQSRVLFENKLLW